MPTQITVRNPTTPNATRLATCSGDATVVLVYLARSVVLYFFAIPLAIMHNNIPFPPPKDNERVDGIVTVQKCEELSFGYLVYIVSRFARQGLGSLLWTKMMGLVTEAQVDHLFLDGSPDALQYIIHIL